MPNFTLIGQALAKYGDFQIFKMAVISDIGFVICVFGHPQSVLCWSLSQYKIWLDSVQLFRQYASFNMVHVRTEMRIHAPKIGVYEVFHPNMGSSINATRKRHFLA